MISHVSTLPHLPPPKSLNTQPVFKFSWLPLIVLQFVRLMIQLRSIRRNWFRSLLFFKNLLVPSRRIFFPLWFICWRNLKPLVLLIMAWRGDLTCSSVLCISSKWVVTSSACSDSCWTSWQRDTLFSDLSRCCHHRLDQLINCLQNDDMLSFLLHLLARLLLAGKCPLVNYLLRMRFISPGTAG